MDSEDELIAALVELHRGLEREGPGDAAFSREILAEIAPRLPERPRIADLGCGSGSSALLLAEVLGGPVLAVDASEVFIDALRERARRAGLEHLITPILGDMGALDWPAGSIDLLWSEGAAYNLGFERALGLWRPLLAAGGIAVVSEMSWFADEVPRPARDFWQRAYPVMGSEAENQERARRTGFDVLFTRRLPSSAWWANYYGPLRGRIAAAPRTPAMQAVIRDSEEEMALFERYDAFYGYTFYVMAAA